MGRIYVGLDNGVSGSIGIVGDDIESFFLQDTRQEGARLYKGKERSVPVGLQQIHGTFFQIQQE